MPFKFTVKTVQQVLFGVMVVLDITYRTNSYNILFTFHACGISQKMLHSIWEVVVPILSLESYLIEVVFNVQLIEIPRNMGSGS